MDGHTDRRPIATARFRRTGSYRPPAPSPSSSSCAARASRLSALAATGYGEFHPLDARNTEEAYARNRRIELKLTSRKRRPWRPDGRQPGNRRTEGRTPCSRTRRADRRFFGVPASAPRAWPALRSRTTNDSASVDSNTSTSDSTSDTVSVTMLVPNIHLPGRLRLEEQREHDDSAQSRKLQHAKACMYWVRGIRRLSLGSWHCTSAAPRSASAELTDDLGERGGSGWCMSEQQRDRREEQGGVVRSNIAGASGTAARLSHTGTIATCVVFSIMTCVVPLPPPSRSAVVS